jgi:hypothetical protein
MSRPPRRSIPPACLLALAAAACAGQQPVVRRADGPPILVGPDAICRSVSDPHGGEGVLVSDGQLCGDLVEAFKGALERVGYRVVDTPDDPHVARARIVAHQSLAGPATGAEAAFLTVQVLIVSNGEEIERAAEDGNTWDAGGERQQVRDFARAIAVATCRQPSCGSAASTRSPSALTPTTTS